MIDEMIAEQDRENTLDSSFEQTCLYMTNPSSENEENMTKPASDGVSDDLFELSSPTQTNIALEKLEESTSGNESETTDEAISFIAQEYDDVRSDLSSQIKIVSNSDISSEDIDIDNENLPITDSEDDEISPDSTSNSLILDLNVKDTSSNTPPSNHVSSQTLGIMKFSLTFPFNSDICIRLHSFLRDAFYNPSSVHYSLLYYNKSLRSSNSSYSSKLSQSSSDQACYEQSSQSPFDQSSLKQLSSGGSYINELSSLNSLNEQNNISSDDNSDDDSLICQYDNDNPRLLEICFIKCDELLSASNISNLKYFTSSSRYQRKMTRDRMEQENQNEINDFTNDNANENMNEKSIQTMEHLNGRANGNLNIGSTDNLNVNPGDISNVNSNNISDNQFGENINGFSKITADDNTNENLTSSIVVSDVNPIAKLDANLDGNSDSHSNLLINSNEINENSYDLNDLLWSVIWSSHVSVYEKSNINQVICPSNLKSRFIINNNNNNIETKSINGNQNQVFDDNNENNLLNKNNRNRSSINDSELICEILNKYSKQFSDDQKICSTVMNSNKNKSQLNNQNEQFNSATNEQLTSNVLDEFTTNLYSHFRCLSDDELNGSVGLEKFRIRRATIKEIKIKNAAKMEYYRRYRKAQEKSWKKVKSSFPNNVDRLIRDFEMKDSVNVQYYPQVEIEHEKYQEQLSSSVSLENDLISNEDLSNDVINFEDSDDDQLDDRTQNSTGEPLQDDNVVQQSKIKRNHLKATWTYSDEMVRCVLDKLGIRYATEKDLRAFAAKYGYDFSNTPDFILLDDVRLVLTYIPNSSISQHERTYSYQVQVKHFNEVKKWGPVDSGSLSQTLTNVFQIPKYLHPNTIISPLRWIEVKETSYCGEKQFDERSCKFKIKSKQYHEHLSDKYDKSSGLFLFTHNYPVTRLKLLAALPLPAVCLGIHAIRKSRKTTLPQNSQQQRCESQSQQSDVQIHDSNSPQFDTAIPSIPGQSAAESSESNQVCDAIIHATPSSTHIGSNLSFQSAEIISSTNSLTSKHFSIKSLNHQVEPKSGSNFNLMTLNSLSRKSASIKSIKVNSKTS